MFATGSHATALGQPLKVIEATLRAPLPINNRTVFTHARLFMPPSSPWEDYNYKSLAAVAQSPRATEVTFCPVCLPEVKKVVDIPWTNGNGGDARRRGEALH